jgi:hypothetical protein
MEVHIEFNFIMANKNLLAPMRSGATLIQQSSSRMDQRLEALKALKTLSEKDIEVISTR